MMAHKKILTLGFCLLLVGGAFSFICYEELKMKNQQEMILQHSMLVTLPTPDQTKILILLERFAKEHGLKMAYGFRSQDEKNFLLQMSSDKVNILVVKLPNENFYRIPSYVYKTSIDEPKPITTGLMNDLRTDIESITGAKVTVEH